jgi:dihydrofolate synthase/folylpolyglutamate synthase
MGSFLDRLLDLEKAPLARAYTAEQYDLQRFRTFVDSLGHPDRDLLFIHIAGTKGKGSTGAFCEGLLRGLGYPTAFFSSPHLGHYGERFRFDGVPWTFDEFEAALERFWERLGPEQRRGFEGPQPWRTVFETLTALALVEFQTRRQMLRAQGIRRPLVVCWETGLGGRLDCTNIVTPAVSVITLLAMDHMKVLGDTIELIAGEKAGIIKQGRPVVVTRQSERFHDRVWPVLVGRAAEVGAPLIRAWEHNPVEWQGTNDVRGTLPDGTPWEGISPLAGAFQRGNLEGSLAAVYEVHRLHGSGPFHAVGLSHVHWPGRLERLPHGERTLVLDGAHCPASALAVGRTLRDDLPAGSLTVLWGMQRDKDAAGFAAALAESLRSAIAELRCYPVGGPRGADAESLVVAAQSAGLPARPCSSAEDALAGASTPTILCVGTLYTLDRFRTLWSTLPHHA